MLRRLARQSSVYALASVVSKASGFVLLVFYADPDVLPKADLGVLGGLDAAKAFALLVAGAGLPLGIIQFASSPALGERERAAVPATALALAAVAGCVVAALGWAAAPPIAAAFGMAGRAEVVRWLAVYVGFKTVADVAYTVLRQREKAGAFVLLGTLEMGLLVAAVLWFLVVQGQGLVGVMKGYAVSAVALAAVTTPLLLARVDRRVAAGLVRPMLVFGLPLVVSGFAGRFLNLGDRFLLLHFLGGEATAVYEVASRFGGVVNVFLVQSFNLAFTVLGLKALGGGAGGGGDAEIHRQSFRHLAAVAGWMVLGLGLFMGDVARVLFPDDPTYAQADGLTVLVGGGFAFYGLYFVVVNVLYAAGRTGAVAATVGGAAVLNLALNLALIPALGAAGAAWATLVAYAALAVVTARLGQRSTPVAYPWRALAVVVALVAGLWALAQPTAAWPTAARLAGRGGIALAYPALLVALGVYGRAEIARAAGVLRR
ncbi:lipopolysaccharide biosynthesis protein [Rubrivirga litoralis]|uniref:Polysaccharide biosynthesis C-terminal domain-containing protein n=1 Tax=Rubrivirga litoralis TaxID=3075598 RepID=A0ABU3BUK1_9BACT|nr:polysaccharide biosynthesis C-terminal domain-containing protein [Rubrivirga sp. F394]MDT0632970.1 polysaccharide biosynthesis C-terminal domain-containing protein [Rubrivirga sp. F394]